MLRNDEVAHRFIQGVDGGNRNLRSECGWLISYGTAVAYRGPNYILVSKETFSPTTNRHISYVRGSHVIEVDGFSYGVTRPFNEEQVPELIRDTLVSEFDCIVRKFDNYKRRDFKVKLFFEELLGKGISNMSPWYFRGREPFVQRFNRYAERFKFRKFDKYPAIRRMQDDIRNDLTVLRLKGYDVNPTQSLIVN